MSNDENVSPSEVASTVSFEVLIKRRRTSCFGEEVPRRHMEWKISEEPGGRCSSTTPPQLFLTSLLMRCVCKPRKNINGDRKARITATKNSQTTYLPKCRCRLENSNSMFLGLWHCHDLLHDDFTLHTSTLCSWIWQENLDTSKKTSTTCKSVFRFRLAIWPTYMPDNLRSKQEKKKPHLFHGQ